MLFAFALKFPTEIFALLFTIILILSLTPYAQGMDFGMFKVPILNPRAQRIWKIFGPILLVILGWGFLSTNDDQPANDIDISGIYTTTAILNDSTFTTSTLNIEQDGTQLTGTKKTKNYLHNKFRHEVVYELRGEIHGGYILLSTKSKDNNRIGLATGIFKVTDSGTRLTGSAVGINNFTGEVLNLPQVIWQRD